MHVAWVPIIGEGSLEDPRRADIPRDKAGRCAFSFDTLAIEGDLMRIGIWRIDDAALAELLKRPDVKVEVEATPEEMVVAQAKHEAIRGFAIGDKAILAKLDDLKVYAESRVAVADAVVAAEAVVEAPVEKAP